MLVTRQLHWGQDRVTYYGQDGKLRSIPAAWTNLGDWDEQLRRTSTSTYFRLPDLLKLAALLQAMADDQE